MKRLIAFILILGTTLIGRADEVYSEERETLSKEEIFRRLATPARGKENIGNIRKIIELMRLGTDHLNYRGEPPLEGTVPAVDFILKSYGAEEVPLLLDYAISVNDKWLKRRAIYCIEKITERKIRVYLNEKFGEGEVPEKLAKLLVESESKEHPARIGKGKHIDFYFPPGGYDLNQLMQKKLEEHRQGK